MNFLSPDEMALSGTEEEDPPQDGTTCAVVEFKSRRQKFIRKMSTLILRYGLPFDFGESRYLIDLLNCYPGGGLYVTRSVCISTFVKLYKREKGKMQEMLRTAPGKINFTCDYWVCISSETYICLTAYYIDQDWNLRRTMVNVSIILDEGRLSVSKHASELLEELGLDCRKAFSMTWDDDIPPGFSDGRLLSAADCIPVRGIGLLNSIVKDVLKDMEVPIQKTRWTVQRVIHYPDIKKKFLDCMSSCSLEATMELRQDVPTCWYSTLVMLSGAVYYRRAFLQLATTEDEPRPDIYPSEDEWDNLEKFCGVLGCVHNFIVKLSGTKRLTSSMFFPGIVSIYMSVKKAVVDGDSMSHDQGVGSKIFEKLNDFWKDFSQILAIAAVFDPRYKFSFVEFSLNKVYGDDGSAKCVQLKEKLYSLFHKYAEQNVNAVDSFPEKQNKDSSWEDLMEEFSSCNQVRDVDNLKSELDKYLDETGCDTDVDLDVLSFWKGNSFRYPQLAAMARDLLSIPVSSVVLESATDIEGKEIGEFGRVLQPDTVQAIICTKSWLRGEEEIAGNKAKLDELTPNGLEEEPCEPEESEDSDTDDEW